MQPPYRSLSRALTVILLLVLAGTVICFICVVAAKPWEPLTEFYLLGPGGRAEGYPSTLKVGEPAEVIAGIVNREGGTVVYEVAVAVGGVSADGWGPVVLGDGERAERVLTFTPQGAGGQKVEFFLYRQGEDMPYRSLYLPVNVRE